jgi:DNA repair protein RecO (recombination protein O)
VSYQIYSTDGIILGSVNTGEADKLYTVFTRDFGVLTTKATGVRKLASKLRFVMQDFSLVGLNMVYGKMMWRLTNAWESDYQTLSKDKKLIIARALRLIRRMIQGEESNEVLFDSLIKDIKSLQSLGSLDETTLEAFEVLFAFRILFHTGYVAREDWNTDFIDAPFGEVLVSEVIGSKKKLVSLINKALTESHL